MSRLVPLRELKAGIQRGYRLIGLDVGSKTIGVALSDTTLTIATPMETIARTKFRNDAARLAAIVAEQKVGGFVIGWPVNMDGSEGPRCQSTMSFCENLSGVIDLPQTLWDERLSTAAVERTLLDADSSRARRKEVIDKMAAAYILQGALDAF